MQLSDHAPSPVRLLSAEIVDVERVQLGAWSILEEGGAVLALALLDPVPVDTEGTAIDDLQLIGDL
ncbi:hypothetical protein M5D96_012469 [Drosophila gunungcola]|uniref:Uncharacterized protein n=1 Tax=Drosophila gunungcola TaxID=103775 RepID=A0A9Q0BKC3_9MUSC|nr:hypothetical protein M5D96_012469 [Drosophila gunungcola]